MDSVNCAPWKNGILPQIIILKTRSLCLTKIILLAKIAVVPWWRRGVVVITTAQLHSTKPDWTQVLCRFKPCLQCVGDLQWWGSLPMAPAGNKAKCLFSVKHTTKTIHHHHSSFSFSFHWLFQVWPL